VEFETSPKFIKYVSEIGSLKKQYLGGGAGQASKSKSPNSSRLKNEESKGENGSTPKGGAGDFRDEI
jgi:hypothetical protein